MKQCLPLTKQVLCRGPSHEDQILVQHVQGQESELAGLVDVGLTSLAYRVHTGEE